MNSSQLYKDIQVRTNGEIYIGVVGPVRTGKSTFIKRFMEVLVLPQMADEPAKARTKDELPQSASGRTIMTTEPKFIPKEAAVVNLMDDVPVKFRLIDCVGYMVNGAAGHIEEGKERQVKTPWFDYEIPFTKAAGIGTQKVIHDHSTIGIVVTTDGSIGELERDAYRDAEDKTIQELLGIGKPFIVLVNSTKPYSEGAQAVVQELESKYPVTVMAVNCEQLKESDIQRILEGVLAAFPITEIQFFIPKWVEMLPEDHEIRMDIIANARNLLETMDEMGDAARNPQQPDSPYITEIRLEEIGMDTGIVKVRFEVARVFYYEMLTELTGTQINGERDLIGELKELAALKKSYEGVRDAFESVRARGYGVVSPSRNEISLDEPVVIKQGSKYGVKIHSTAPSIHMIRANIETEIAPIVGSEQQAKDLIGYIKEKEQQTGGIWDTNIFGKSVEELVMDGMRNKMAMINDESQVKLQDTMQKIVNDSNGGLVCIII